MPEAPNQNPVHDASPSILKQIIRFVKRAGSKSEEDFKGNGFLSYHAETHAAGLGIAAGWWYGAEGNTELLSLVYAAAVHGEAHARNGKRRRILRDIVQEPHYALGGVPIGAALGAMASWAVDTSGVDPFEVFEMVPLVLTWVMAGV
jgi:hypothetical protein